MASAVRYLRPDVIAQVQRLDLRARFIVEGFVSGLHSSPFHGASVEFSEHRKYVPGDDLRTIDYNVLAKTDRLYVKKFQAETNLECYLVVDVSASMNYPDPGEAAAAGRLSKLEYASCLAAALGWMMVHQQDAVGMAVFDNRLRTFIPARSTRSHLMQLLGELSRAAPESDQAGKGLATALHEVARRVHKRGLVIVLSDFLAATEEVVQALHHLRFRGHDLILFQILDYTEAAFPFEGLSRFEDPETGQELTAEPAAMRRAYLEALGRFREEYRRQAAAMRSDFVPIDTSMTFDRALIQFLIERQRRY